MMKMDEKSIKMPEKEPEKREILLKNGAKFVLSGCPIELPDDQKRFFISTPQADNGYFDRVFQEKKEK